MQLTYAGIGNVSTMIKIGAKLTTAGTAIEVMGEKISAIRPHLKTALDQVEEMDSIIYPMLNKIDQGLSTCESCESTLCTHYD